MFPITIKDGLKALYSKVWTGLTNALGGPWKTLSGAVALGKTLANVWLSTDAQIEKYFQMSCLMSIRQVLSPMCSEARLGYLSAPTQENAESYLAIMDMLMGVYELELKQSKDYVSILDNALINQVLEHYDAYESHSALIAGFDSERTKMQREYEFSKEASTAIAVQAADTFENVYGDNALVIASQQEFDWYCQLYADLKAVNEAWVTQLPVKCNADITIDGDTRDIGPTEFRGLTLDKSAKLSLIEAIKGDSVTIKNKSELVVKGIVDVGSVTLDDSSTLESDSIGDIDTCVNITVKQSSIESETITSCNLMMNGSSIVDIDGNANISSVKGMSAGDVIRVRGALTVGGGSRGGEIGAGTVEAYGDVAFVGKSGFKGVDGSLLVLCGGGEQTLSCVGGSQSGTGAWGMGSWTDWSRPGPLALRNPRAVVSLGTSSECPATLAEDGSCASLSCSSLDLAGHSLEVSGDLRADSLSATSGSTLSCASIARGGEGSANCRVSAEGCSIQVAGRATVYATLSASSLSCGSLEASILGLSGGSDADISGDATISGVKYMGAGDALSVHGTLRIGRSPEVCSEVKGGTVKAYGDVALVGNSGFRGSSGSLFVLCGDGEQELTCAGGTYNDGRWIDWSRPGPLARRNPRAVVSLGTSSECPATLAEDGACASLSCSSLDLAGHSLSVSGDASFALSGMSVESVLHVGGNLSARTSQSQSAGTVEVCGDFATTGTYSSSGTHMVVFCGDGPQTAPSSKLYNVVNAHADESEVTGLTYSGTYIHDPDYQTGDRYIQLATVSNMEYTGGYVAPMVKYGSLELEEGKDYEVVTNTGDGQVAVGTYNLELVGLPPYKGSKTFAYQITRANISNATVTGVADVTYDGQVHQPEVAVTLGDRTLEKDVDYTVSYGSNKSVGTGYVYVNGKGSYTGSKTINFKINPTEAAQRVIDLIAALNVNYLSGEEGVVAARAAYDALAQLDKEAVTNYSRLTSAESTMRSLHESVATAEAAIADAEAFLTETPVSADGADVDEGKPWLTQAQVDGINSKLSSLRSYIDAGGTLSNLRNATSNLTSTCNTAKSALETQLGTRHVPGEPVEQNRVEPTCTEEGSCDLVTLCSVCGEELSREPKTIDALGHDYQPEVVAPTWDEPGYTRHTCGRCGEMYDDEPVESLKLQGVRAVEEDIAALPGADDLALADADAVAAARAAFDALTEEQQGMVSNAELLVLAEARMADLVAAAEVDALIAALPVPADVDLMDQAQVEAARAAYDALSDSQKALVKNLERLEGAEQAIADLIAQLQLVGTCVWEVTDGELVIAPIPGRTMGVLPDSWTDAGGQWLWSGLMGGELTSAVTSVRFESGVVAGRSLSGMVGTATQGDGAGFANLRTADLTNLDTTGVTDVSWLFAGCASLQSVVGIESLVGSGVTNATGVFAGCSSLEALDLSSWDTSGIADAAAIDGLIDGCDALEEVRFGQGFEAQRLGVALPAGTWTNGSLYVGGDGIDTIASEQVAATWRRHTPVDISEGCEFLPIPVQEHTGSPVTPVPVILYEGKVVGDPDGAFGTYTLDYQNNVEIGEATVTIAGQGFFCGEKTLSFRILAKEDFDVESMIEALQRAVDAAQGERDAAQAAYEEAVESGADAEVAKKDLDEAKTALSEAQANLSEATDLGNATLSELPTYTYSGMPAEPTPTVTARGVELRLGTDYALSYEGNTDAGTAKVVVSGKGLFSGRNVAEFVIDAKSINDVAVLTVPDETYSGSAVEPELVLTDGEKALVAGEDYEVAYEKNVGAGDAVAHVAGKGNYAGARDVSFRIRKAPIEPTVTLASWSWLDAPNAPVVKGNAEDAEVVFEYKAKDAGDDAYALVAPSDPGEYVVRATVGEGANHLGATCTCEFAITWLGVTFDANGGEGTMDPQGFEHEATQALRKNTFARDGQRFRCWNTKADGSGQSFEDEATVTLAESMTLYAQWTDAQLAPAFKKQSLLLSGQIGVNFFVDLSMLSEEEREGARMEFEVCGKRSEDAFDATCTSSDGKYHGFTCYVTSVQMADEIRATLRWGEGNAISRTHSVLQYVESFERSLASFDSETIALVRSLADMGHYVQPFLSRERGWQIGVDHAEMPAGTVWSGSEDGEAEAATEGYAASKDLPEGCGISRTTLSLTLDAGTDVCLYLTPDAGVSVVGAALADGTALDARRQSDGRWRVTIPNLKAHQLSRTWDVTVATSTGTDAHARVSGLSWVRAALTYDDWRGDDVTRDAAASIWRYSAAADAYRAKHG